MGYFKPYSYFLAGQLCLYTSALICALLKPEGVTLNDGLSYYSAYASTVIPYTVGLAGAAILILLMVLVAHRLPALARISFALVALLLVGLLLTPYQKSRQTWELHVLLGTCLFAVQYFMLLVVTLKHWFNPRGLLYLLASTIVVVVAGRYLGSSVGYLLLGQMVFQLLWGYAMWRYLRRAARP